MDLFIETSPKIVLQLFEGTGFSLHANKYLRNPLPKNKMKISYINLKNLQGA